MIVKPIDSTTTSDIFTTTYTSSTYVPSYHNQPPPIKDIKKEFREYLKDYLKMYESLYTAPIEKEAIEALKKLLLIDALKSL